MFFLFIILSINLHSPKRGRKEEISNTFSQQIQSISSSESNFSDNFLSQENSSNSNLKDITLSFSSTNTRTLVFLDTETTGASNNDEIIEIAAIKYLFNKNSRNFIELETFHKRIKPNKKITKNAKKVHKITQEELNKCPKFKDIAQEFLNFIEESTIVAYNSRFDIRMINLEFERLNFKIPNINKSIKKLKYEESIDPLQIAMKQIRKKDEKHQYTLINVSKHLRIKDIDEKHLHNALPDAKLLFEVYKKLIIKKHDLHSYGF